MTWADFYLTCFLVGFALSLLSVLGTVHLHIHLPFSHGHAGGHAAHGDGLSIFNFGTIAAFLAWFGGTGYLLNHYYGIAVLVALAIAIFSGIGGAAIIFWFLSKLMSRERALDPADYEMVGVLGHITNTIRTGGTGEITYSQGGTRHVSAARSELGVAVPKGAEVVVTRYERGIAFVQDWDELTSEQSNNSTTNNPN